MQQQNSIWVNEARGRWYNCRILGDGPYAVVLCHDTVKLTDMEMWARGMVEHDCSVHPGACRLQHTLYDLRQKPTPKFGTGHEAMRVTADRIERDR